MKSPCLSQTGIFRKLEILKFDFLKNKYYIKGALVERVVMRRKNGFLLAIATGSILCIAGYFLVVKQLLQSQRHSNTTTQTVKTPVVIKTHKIEEDTVKTTNPKVVKVPKNEPQKKSVQCTAYQGYKQAVKEGNLTKALKLLKTAYQGNLPETTRGKIKQEMMKINTKLIYSKTHHYKATIYTVKAGDSVWTIARKFKVPIGMIKMVNNLHKNNYIFPGQKLKILTGKFSILVKKSEFKLYLLYEGAFFKQYTIAIGKDDSTPSGRFKIARKVRKPAWEPVLDGRRVRFEYGDPQNPLGELWMQFDNPSDLGIHGTNDDSSLGKMSTNGCIRLSNRDVLELGGFVSISTEVVIED
jgi:lipoprotein-anchoring transpeptidase ErfK/SrfK